jgi:hypothetical protein
MATIVELPPPVPGEAASLTRIRGLSRPLEWLFAALFVIGAVILATAVVGVLAYDGPRLQVRPGGMQIMLGRDVPPLPPGWTTVGVLPFTRKLALAGSATLMIGPALAVLWELRRLFGLYHAGIVLGAENARCIGRIALWLLAYAVAPTLGHILVSASGFDDDGWLRLDSAKALCLGLVLLVIARVMQLGAEVHDDASRFV